jgi:hypothetical protein
LALTALAVGGCGSSGSTTYANNPRPATPINLTVYIGGDRVSVSPSKVGGGPVVFLVTNQSKRAQSLSVAPAGGGGALASTGPINPQGTAQVTVNLTKGDYLVATSSDASQGQATGMTPGHLSVGPPRPSADGNLLTP